MKKTKVNKPSTPIPTLANPCDVEERLRRLSERDDEGSFFPVTESFINNLAKELIEWADKQDSFLLNDFYNPRGYNRERLNKWTLKFPVFGAAFQYAKDMIGARREKKRILETNCAFTLGGVNSDWKEKEDQLHERKLQLAAAKDKAQTPTLIQVITKKTEDCPEVPHAPKGPDVDQS
jgi:hypothetical protein